jgi:FAD/FMN-containing dehydrogenase
MSALVRVEPVSPPASPASGSLPAPTEQALRAIVGDPHLLTDPTVTGGWATDWTGRFQGATPAVVRPGSTAEVAAVLARCAADGVAVVPQGGNTGLVGGSVSLDGEVILSLRRLDALPEAGADAIAGQLSAGAGVTIERVAGAAREAGWAYGCDWGARASATVGGSVATNAGGLRVLRYGDTRAQVLGVEAVLADGSVISHLGGLVKDNTGYHLPSLLCGSEGTLAVVTAARLRLVPRFDERVVALLGFDSVDEAVAATSVLRRALPSVEAIELCLGAGLALVCDRLRLPPPLPGGSPPALLTVECADRSDPTATLAEVVSSLAGVTDAVVATDGPRRAALWRYREGHTEAVNLLGSPHKLDVTLPASALAAFVAEVPHTVARLAPGASTWMFGHAADGNVHVNVTGLDPHDDRVDGAVFTLVAEMGGSISAEHGIGNAKRRWLSLNRSPAELAAFRAVKQAFDPNRILNPNVLLPEG